MLDVNKPQGHGGMDWLELEPEIETIHSTEPRCMKRAYILRGIPVVAATYSVNGTRLCHENLALLPKQALSVILARLDSGKT